MKTRIKKILIMAVALFFAGAGVSFAHDLRGSKPNPRENGFAYYKKGYVYHPGRYNHHPEPKYKFREKDRHRKHPAFYHHDHRVRPVPHKGSILGFKVYEPGLKLFVVVKDRR